MRLLIIAVSLCWLAPANGDDLRPLYVELRSGAGTDVEVIVRSPPQVDPRNRPSVLMPAFCEPAMRSADRARYVCAGNLAGAQLSVVWPLQVVAVPTVIRWLEGERVQTLSLRPREMTWVLPGSGDSPRAFLQYVWLGFEHIWIGYDHLLFIACLIWIAGSLPRILLAISGFTLAHSVTLALASLGVLRLPIPWVEAVIALSVVFLAAEIVRGRKTLTTRYPLLVSSLFGLLHGLGFAAVLADIALPANDLIAGLLGFNVGVELGQLAFVVTCVLLLSALRYVTAHWHLSEYWIRHGAGYATGTLAGFWVIERVAAFVA